MELHDLTRTVLIVEDEPIIRMALADHIASQGYEVLEAGSGDRALELLQLPETIDVVVTDDMVLARIRALLEDENTMRSGPSHIPVESGKTPLS